MIDKEQYEWIKFVDFNTECEMHGAFLESAGYDLEKLFIEKPTIFDIDTSKTQVNTKKRDQTISSDDISDEVLETIKEISENYFSAKNPRELSKEKLKKYFHLYENSDFDKENNEFKVLIFYEELYSLTDVEFKYNKPLTGEIDTEFIKASDRTLFAESIGEICKLQINYNLEIEPVLLHHENDTGYIVPTFYLLNKRVTNSKIIQEYDNLIVEFKLKYQEGISIENVATISQFKDLMYSQLNRQLEAVKSLNESIKNHLKFLYRFIELYLLQINKNQNPDNYREIPPYDWIKYAGMVRSINLDFAGNYLDRESLEKHLSKIKLIPIFSEEFKESICLVLDNVYQKKEPILDIAKKLLIKIRCVESIIEDILMEQTLKSPEDFVEWFKSREERISEEEISGEDIICAAVKLKRQGITVLDTFKKIRQWLLNEEEGFGEKEFKEKYGFGISDKDTFNRYINLHQKNCPPENN